MEKRLSEAAKMGFKTAVVPRLALRGVKVPADLAVVGVSTLAEAIQLLRKK